jgi:hypothetical protein
MARRSSLILPKVRVNRKRSTAIIIAVRLPVRPLPLRGSLVLGAAGLLKDDKAISHWAARETLREFGAEPDDARVVIDRNRITGAGVSAGIDFGLHIIAKTVATRQSFGRFRVFPVLQRPHMVRRVGWPTMGSGPCRRPSEDGDVWPGALPSQRRFRLRRCGSLRVWRLRPAMA